MIWRLMSSIAIKKQNNTAAGGVTPLRVGCLPLVPVVMLRVLFNVYLN